MPNKSSSFEKKKAVDAAAIVKTVVQFPENIGKEKEGRGGNGEAEGIKGNYE